MRTVQGVLEDALAPHAGPVETVVAGRTDKGVHARGQVVSFTTERVIDPARLRRALNRRLGPEISIAAITPAPPGFHARFSATGRTYVYLVVDGEVPDPFLAATAWHNGTRLDETVMAAAAEQFVGLHDFASFCRHSKNRTTVRTVRTAVWTRRRSDLLAFDIAASSFCHQMVRSLVALCVDVGRGHTALEQVPEILAARDRGVASGVAPPHGLTLVAVDYPQSSIQ